MNATLKIVIADDERSMREFLITTIEQLGHEVVGYAKTGTELL